MQILEPHFRIADSGIRPWNLYFVTSPRYCFVQVHKDLKTLEI